MKRPDTYHDRNAHPVGATHPNYPNAYRVSSNSIQDLQRSDGMKFVASCLDCPVRHDCDHTCGIDHVWVSAVTWIRIRMMEAQQ